MLTYNLLSQMSTAPSLEVSDEAVSSAMAETKLSVVSPQWPTERNSESLVTAKQQICTH